jgi:Tfp pilus tip-associated adhesin PilY1
MNTCQNLKHPFLEQLRNALILFCALAAPVQAAITDIDSTPLGTLTISTLPNLMVMLDDSGSMDWDYLPDNAGNFSGYFGFESAHCNGTYYNPNITYTVPVDSTGTQINSAAPSAFTAAYVDGFNPSAGTVNLNTGFTGGSGSGSSGAPRYTGPAFYYTYTGTQNLGWQQNYYNTSGTFYTECKSGSVGSSGAAIPTTQPFTKTTLGTSSSISTVTVTAAPAPTASIAVSGSSSTPLTSITVNGTTIANAVTGSATNNTEATNIKNAINALTGTTHYSASCTGGTTCSSSTVTVSGFSAAASQTIVVNKSSGSDTFGTTAQLTFTSPSVTSITVNGLDIMSGTAASCSTTACSTTIAAANIAAEINASGYSATSSGAVVTITAPSAAAGYAPVVNVSPGLTATAGSVFPAVDDNAADLLNFANWYSYYSHRMLMMKSGLGLAFSNLLYFPNANPKYRVGFMTMNNNVSPDFVNISDFVGGCAANSGACQKDLWYTKLYGAVAANSTPLREALSHVGQLYAHHFGSVTTYTATITVTQSSSCTGATPCPAAATSVQINGAETLNCALISSTNPTNSCSQGSSDPITANQIAQNIANQINAMVVTDYGASASGNVVTITGVAAASGYAPVVTFDNVNSATPNPTSYTSTAFNGTTTTAQLNGVTPTDPMEYSCQQNFVLLSTDGFWNGPNTYNLQNNPVGDPDADEPRPLNDGGTPTQQTTSQTTATTDQTFQQQTSTDTLQISTAQLQQSAYPLQSSTYPLQQSSYPLQSSYSTLQSTQSYQLQSSTSNLQSTTTPLNSSTYNLTKSTYDLTQTAYQLLSSTATLTGTVSGELMYCAARAGTNSGRCGTAPASGLAGAGSGCTGTCANWAVATSGTCVTSTSNPYMTCATVTGTSAPAQTSLATCATGSISSSGGTYTVPSGGAYQYSACVYNSYSTPAAATTCTYNVSTASPYTTGSKCSYSTTATTSTVAPCTIYSESTSTANGTAYNANSSGYAVTSCAYQTTPVSTATNGTCQAAAQSTSSPYAAQVTCVYASTPTSTATNLSSCLYQSESAVAGVYTGPAVICAYGTASTSNVTTGNTCTTQATVGTATTGVTWHPVVSCAYTAYSTPANASACTYTTPSTSSPYSVLTPTKCSYATLSTPIVSNVTSCTPVAETTATTNGTVYNVTPLTCAYTAYSTPAPVATCTYENQSTASPYAGPAVKCSYGTPAVSTVSSCTLSNETTATTNGTVYNPSAVGCAYAAPVVNNNAGSCTYQNKSTGTSNGTVYTGPAYICSYGTATVSNVSSCTASAQTTGTANNTVYNPNAIGCSYSAWSTPVNASGTCTAVAQSTTSPYAGPATNCTYSDGTWTNVSSCIAVPESTSSPYTVLVATECQNVAASCSAGQNGCIDVHSVTIGVPSCTSATASASNNYTTTSCATNTTTSNVTACTAASPSSANNYTTITCTPGSGGQPNTLANVAEYYYVTDLRDNSLNNCTGALGGDVCANDVPSTTLDPANWQHMTTFTLGLGARGSMDYTPYESIVGGVSNPNYVGPYTSLNAGCNVNTQGDFCAVYNSSAMGSTGTATGAEAGETICNWQSATTICNWSIPSSGSINNIDDLWHAAVTGRGSYFSATDPASLAAGLSSSLAQIQERAGSSAAATTSTPNLTQTNNYIFSSLYTTGLWVGDLFRQTIAVSGSNTGGIYSPSAACANSTTSYDWEANGPDTSCSSTPYQLDTLALSSQTSTAPGGANRNIYSIPVSSSSLNTGSLFAFTYSNMSTTEQNYFNMPYISTGTKALSQFCTTSTTTVCLSSAQQTSAAGVNLVNYLRGDTSNLGYYYNRSHVLGDIVNSKSAYVAQPQFNYGDANYTAFANNNTSRTGMIYVGANDGMLHAFYAGGQNISTGDNSGAEAWAYIPALVVPNLYLLADQNYSTKHTFFVDGTPVTGDICPNAPGATCSASQWKTILVGGLNAGGAGFYALDITNVASTQSVSSPVLPTPLWEFKDADMGDSFGNPAITKLADGTWVVLLTSGYNNPSGNGHLYILNAYTGALIREISTGVGTPGSPSGLAQIAAHVSNPDLDNTTLEVYAGDLLGNLWRFDVNNTLNSAYPYAAQLITTLKDSSGNAQPITSAPAIGVVNNQAVVFVGTGQLLGVSDLTTSQVNTMYGIMDPLTVSTASPTTPIYSSPQSKTCSQPSSGTTITATNCFVQQTAVDTTCPANSPASICTGNSPVRTSTSYTMTFPSGGTSGQYGWYINFPDTGERDNTNPALALGSLVFVTNTPTTGTACEAGGYSYVWFLNYATGAPVSNSPTGVVSSEVGNQISSAVTLYTAGGTPFWYVPVPPPCPTCVPPPHSLPTGGSGAALRRTSWRELITQ